MLDTDYLHIRLPMEEPSHLCEHTHAILLLCRGLKFSKLAHHWLPRACGLGSSKESYLLHTGPSESLLQATMGECAGHGGLVRVKQVDDTAKAKHSRDKGTDLRSTLAGRSPGVHLGGQASKDIVILVNLRKRLGAPSSPEMEDRASYRLTEVAALLLVPPVAVRVSELALLGRGVDVTAVLGCIQSAVCRRRSGECTDHSGVSGIGVLRVLLRVQGRGRGLSGETDDERAGRGGDDAGLPDKRPGDGQSLSEHLLLMSERPCQGRCFAMPV
jgi:hypothetical protein